MSGRSTVTPTSTVWVWTNDGSDSVSVEPSGAYVSSARLSSSRSPSNVEQRRSIDHDSTGRRFVATTEALVECGLNRRDHEVIDTGGHESIITNCEHRTAVDGGEWFENRWRCVCSSSTSSCGGRGGGVDSQERIQKTDQPGNTNFWCPSQSRECTQCCGDYPAGVVGERCVIENLNGATNW